MQVFPGLWVYWDIDVSLKSMDYTHSPVCKVVLMLFDVSILNFSDIRYLFSELRYRIAFHFLLGFGTKNILLKKARDV